MNITAGTSDTILEEIGSPDNHVNGMQEVDQNYTHCPVKPEPEVDPPELEPESLLDVVSAGASAEVVASGVYSGTYSEVDSGVYVSEGAS